MNQFKNNKGEIKIEFEPTVILDFTVRHAEIYLNLGNNFTFQHLIDAYKKCEYFEQIDEYITDLNIDCNIMMYFFGNYGNVKFQINTYDYFDLFH